MTEPYSALGGQPPPADPLLTEFGAALPASVKARLQPTALVAGLLQRATTKGWTIRELAHECSRDLGTAENVGGVVTRRLEHCANTQHSAARKDPLAPWCGMCEDPAFRFMCDTDHNPVRPCPRCSPKRGLAL